MSDPVTKAQHDGSGSAVLDDKTIELVRDRAFERTAGLRTGLLGRDGHGEGAEDNRATQEHD